MKSKEGFVQAYNAQASRRRRGPDHCRARTHAVRQRSGPPLVPLVEAIENNLGRKPEQAAADSGYCSEANLKALVARAVSTASRHRTWTRPAPDSGKRKSWWTADATDAQKIDDGGFETPYRLRKQVVEPVFGTDQTGTRLPPVSVARRQEKVRAEWAMICTTHNLLKLFTHAKPA